MNTVIPSQDHIRLGCGLSSHLPLTVLKHKTINPRFYYNNHHHFRLLPTFDTTHSRGWRGPRAWGVSQNRLEKGNGIREKKFMGKLIPVLLGYPSNRPVEQQVLHRWLFTWVAPFWVNGCAKHLLMQHHTAVFKLSSGTCHIKGTIIQLVGSNLIKNGYDWQMSWHWSGAALSACTDAPSNCTNQHNGVESEFLIVKETQLSNNSEFSHHRDGK